MKRRILWLVIIGAFPIALSAQTGPKQMLNEQAVMNFIKNFESIMTGMEQFQPEVDALNSRIDGAGDVSIIQQVMALDIPAGIDQVFKNNGMGDNGFKKMFIISTGFSIIDMEAAIEFGMSNTRDPKIKSEFQDNLNALNRLKMDIHPTDLLLIKSKKDILRPLFG